MFIRPLVATETSTAVLQNAPILKPWTLSTTAPEVIEEFTPFTECPGHEWHARCEKDDTRVSEEYTDQFAQTIHTAVEKIYENRKKMESQSAATGETKEEKEIPTAAAIKLKSKVEIEI